MTLFLMNSKQCAEWLGSQTYDVVGRRHNFCNLFSHIVRCSTMEFRDDGSSKNGGEGARRTKSSFDGTGLTSKFGGQLPPFTSRVPPALEFPTESRKSSRKKSLKSRPNVKAYFCFFMQDHNYASRYRSYIPFFLLL